MNTQPTPAEPTAIELDATLRAANGRGRLDLDAPPAEVPAEHQAPEPVEMADDELDAALLDRTTRRELLADREVRIRLAMRDPETRARIERLEERARVADETAERRMQAAVTRPTPLPGGNFGPVPPAPPSPESILRAAVAAAHGEPVDHNLKPYVRPGSDVTVTGFSPQ